MGGGVGWGCLKEGSEVGEEEGYMISAFYIKINFIN
jgi:hypothetical protein